MGGSRTILKIPEDLAPSLDSSRLSHRSVYGARCLLHLLASSRLLGRWLLSPLCAMPALPSGPPSQLLCGATVSQASLTLAGSPVTSPPTTLSPRTFLKACSSSAWEVASLSTP